MCSHISDEKFIQKSTGKEVAISWEKMSKSKYNGVDPGVLPIFLPSATLLES